MDTPRYCLGCSYNLRRTVDGPCPECGRVFDPADASSFSATPLAKRTWAVTAAAVIALYPLIWVVIAYVEYGVNWNLHGRRPDYDSHGHMPAGWNAAVRPLLGLVYWGMLAMVAGMFALGAALLATRHRTPWAALIFLTPPLAWCAWFVYAFVVDPFGVIEWWLD